MAIFTEIGNKILNYNKLIDPSVASSYLTALKPIAVSVLIILIIWRIFQIMSGSTKKPISDVVNEIVIWSIIWSVVFTSSYLTLFQSAINEAFTYFGGGKTFFTNLDVWWEKLYMSGEILFSKDDGAFDIPLRGAIALSFVLLGAFILNLIPLFIILVASLTINILVALTPFMLLSLLFPVLKKTFLNWVELILTLFLTVLILSIIQKSLKTIIDKFTNNIITTSNNATVGAITGEAAEILIMCGIYGVLFLISVPIAKKVGGAAFQFGTRSN